MQAGAGGRLATIGDGIVPVLAGAFPVAPGLVAILGGIGSILGGPVAVPGGLGPVDGGLVTVGGSPDPCQRRSGLLDHSGGPLPRFLHPKPGQPGEVVGGIEPALRRRRPVCRLAIAPLGGPVAVGGRVVAAGGELVACGRDFLPQPGHLRPSPRRVVARS